MLKQFSTYTVIGLFNTLLHWLIFLMLYSLLDFSQSISNLVAFAVAVVFSFFMNAKLTFRAQTKVHRLLNFTLFMATVSWLVGYGADALHLPPWFTLMFFSAVSLVLGFLYAKFIVFEEEK